MIFAKSKRMMAKAMAGPILVDIFIAESAMTCGVALQTLLVMA